MEKPPHVDDVTAERIRRKLLPENVHASLLKAALVVTAFELLKDEVRSAPYTVLWPRPDEPEYEAYFKSVIHGGRVWTKRYKQELQAFHKDDLFSAAALWLAARGVITEKEAEELVQLRAYRNEVVHELAKFVVDVSQEVRLNAFNRCAELLAKIGRWNASITCDIPPDMADEDITPGRLLIVELLADTFGQLEGTRAEPQGDA